MNQGDIYDVSLNPAIGHEKQGRRPVLIVSATMFNRTTTVPVVLPITTGGKFARHAGLAVPLDGTVTTGVIRIDQPRAIDIRASGGRRIETVPREVLDDVLARLTAIFEHSDR